MKHIFIVRHCEAKGQQKDAPLTKIGQKQARELGDFLADFNIEHIVSSPFVRAIDSALPFSQATNIDIKLDERLSERILSKREASDWLEMLKKSFEDLDLIFDGGESSRTAMNRIVNVVNELRKSSFKMTALFTHGNIMTLLLKHFDNNYGFYEWKKLTNPDVFVMTFDNGHVTIRRIWE